MPPPGYDGPQPPQNYDDGKAYQEGAPHPPHPTYASAASYTSPVPYKHKPEPYHNKPPQEHYAGPHSVPYQPRNARYAEPVPKVPYIPHADQYAPRQYNGQPVIENYAQLEKKCDTDVPPLKYTSADQYQPKLEEHFEIIDMKADRPDKPKRGPAKR